MDVMIGLSADLHHYSPLREPSLYPVGGWGRELEGGQTDVVPLNNLASDQVMNKKKKKKKKEISVAQRLNKWIMVVHLGVRRASILQPASNDSKKASCGGVPSFPFVGCRLSCHSSSIKRPISRFSPSSLYFCRVALQIRRVGAPAST